MADSPELRMIWNTLYLLEGKKNQVNKCRKAQHNILYIGNGKQPKALSCVQRQGENVLRGTNLAVMCRADWGNLKHGDYSGIGQA